MEKSAAFYCKIQRFSEEIFDILLYTILFQGWEYSAAMFVFVNALALVFICYAYLRMINEIRASGVACRSTQQSRERDKVAQRFGIIVFTDCLCWVPVIVVKLTALGGNYFVTDTCLYIYLSLSSLCSIT